MVIFQLGKPFVVFAGIKMYPESKPPGRGWHGLAKEDWVTVWFPGDPCQTNVTVVPLLAVMFGGKNCSAPPDVAAVAPTVI